MTDRGSIRSFQADIKCFSDFDFGSLWSWNYAGTTCICQLYGNLVVSMRGYQDGRETLAVNGEFDVDPTARRLLEDRSNGESPARLELIPKHFADLLNRESFIIEEDRDNHDYVISVRALAALEGSGYSTFRRKVKRFVYAAQLTVIELNLSDEVTKKEILTLFREWCAQKPDDAAVRITYDHEGIAIQRCLRDFGDLGVIGYGAILHGKLAGFALLGHVNQDEVIFHFEKINTWMFKDLSATFKQRVAQLLAIENYKVINFEQDLGVQGLRTSKSSLVPIEMREKFIIRMR